MAKKRGKLPSGIDVYKGRYRVRITYRGYRHTIGLFRSLTLAKLALDRYQAEAILGTFIGPTEQRRRMRQEREQNRLRSMTVGEWSTLWLQSLQDGPNPRSDSTITSYRSTLRTHVLPAIGADTTLVDIAEHDVRRLVATAQRSGAGAAKNAITVFRAMMNAAIATGAGGLTESPIPADLKAPKAGSRPSNEVPTISEVRALEHAMDPDYSLAVPLAAWCQLRLGEVLGLQRGDFHDLDGEHPELIVGRQWASKASPPGYRPPKDDSYRTVAIPSSIVGKILAHLNAGVLPDEDAPLFWSPRDRARPISHNAMGRRWKQATDRVRPGIGFHALRHAGLTAYSRAGGTLQETMIRGGHKDVEAAMRYQHGATERDRELAAALSDLVGES